MNWRLRLPSVVYRLALSKAGDDASLAALVVKFIEDYAHGTTFQAKGGQARQASMTPEERTIQGRAAADARWKKD